MISSRLGVTRCNQCRYLYRSVDLGSENCTQPHLGVIQPIKRRHLKKDASIGFSYQLRIILDKSLRFVAMLCSLRSVVWYVLCDNNTEIANPRPPVTQLCDRVDIYQLRRY